MVLVDRELESRVEAACVAGCGSGAGGEDLRGIGYIAVDFFWLTLHFALLFVT